jgi:flavin reductase (DIM6/NTAB) family NADH-FMN oxidoreductase RutF
MTQLTYVQDENRAAFIEAMRMVASSVAVVTTDGDAGCHGATVNAFSSVSADPPTMLVCLRAQSKISQMVMQNGVFNLNVLSDGADYTASRFAGAHDAEIADRFDGIACDRNGVPSIDGATTFKCTVGQSMMSGSHQIYIGHVTAIDGGVDLPLTYMNGTFHSVVPHQTSDEKR